MLNLTKHSQRITMITKTLNMNGGMILNVQCSDNDQYEIIRKIGRGKYSEVFEGIRFPQQQKVVIKVLKPVKK